MKILSLTCAGAISIFLLVIGVSTAFQDKLSNFSFDLVNAQQENGTGRDDIEILNNITIQNASDPGLGISPDTDDIVAVFHRIGNDSTNLYMIQSQDNGTTFTDPVRVNSKEGDADPAYVSPPVRFGPQGEIFVSWGKIVSHETFQIL